jgi:glycosyltransferase involved in cell wall biosynthesis
MITYNHEGFIAQAIEGVLMQETSFTFELVIGEDCSVDGTATIVREYAQKYPGIIKARYNVSNLGMMTNVVKTLKECTGKYIALCEGDDYWTDPYKLQKQVDALEVCEDYKFCFTSVEILKKKVTHLVRPDFTNYFFCIEDFILNQQLLGTASFVFRNINEIPLWFNKLICADKFFTFYFASKGEAIYLDTSTAVYRDHGDGAHSKLNDSEKVNTVIHDFKIIDKALNFKYHLIFKHSLELSSQYVINNLKLNIALGQYSKARGDIIIWSKIYPVFKIIFKIRARDIVKILLGTTLYLKLYAFYKGFKN